ncbi:MAG: tRNA (adenosine(37)-N6)-dimethylallyltransferase, partial [Gemmatimonadota bacterium]
AERLHPHDRQRVARALAVYFETGRRLSAWQRGGRPAAPRGAICLTRPRAELVARLTARVDGMLVAGLEAEARALHAAGWTPEAPGLATIGYREWWPYFEGQGTAGEARERILTATRRYAKRQMTWFRRQGAYQLVPAERGVAAGRSAWEALQ